MGNQIVKDMDVCGQVTPICYDDWVKELNIQLVRRDGTDGYFVIKLQDWTRNNSTTLVTLHIKEAIELKSIIDNLVYAALSGEWKPEGEENE